MASDRAAPIIDVGVALDDGPWRPAQIVIAVLLTLAFVADGLANQVMAVSVPAIMRDLHVSRAPFASVTAFGLVGVTIGTIFGGALGDRFGRRAMIVLSVLLFGAATMLIAGCRDVSSIGWVRFLDGLGIGGTIPNAAALIAELTPARRRSRADNIALLGIPIGILLCGGFAAGVLPTFGWRSLFVGVGVLSVAFALLMFFSLPESPRYLVRRPARERELRRVLARLGVEDAQKAVIEDASVRREKAPLREIFGGDMRLTTPALWGAFFFCFLAVYVSLNWIPTLFSSHGYPLWATSLTLSAWSIGGIPGALIGAWLIERFGSRVALFVLALGGVIGFGVLSLTPLRPENGVLPILSLLTAQGVFMSGLTGCIYAVAAYIYPAHVKATGVGAAGAVGRSGAIVSSYAAVAAMALGGSEAFFRVAGVATGLSLVFVLLIRRGIPRSGEIIRAAAYR